MTHSHLVITNTHCVLYMCHVFVFAGGEACSEMCQASVELSVFHSPFVLWYMSLHVFIIVVLIFPFG